MTTIPEGWQLVPKKLTPEMKQAADCKHLEGRNTWEGWTGPEFWECYEAALAAAPAPPVGVPRPDLTEALALSTEERTYLENLQRAYQKYDPTYVIGGPNLPPYNRESPAPPGDARADVGIDAAAAYLAKTVLKYLWSGIRDDGRARDRGFDPWYGGVTLNARQEDYRDVVREIVRRVNEPSQSDELTFLRATNARMREALEKCVKLASRDGPPSALDALTAIANVARAALAQEKPE